MPFCTSSEDSEILPPFSATPFRHNFKVTSPSLTHHGSCMYTKRNSKIVGTFHNGPGGQPQDTPSQLLAVMTCCQHWELKNPNNETQKRQCTRAWGFLQPCDSGLRYCWIRRCIVEYSVSDVSKERDAFIFKGQESFVGRLGP
jgi:hypothetical protein